MALYGYARVSTSDQDLTLQTQILRAAGCEIRHCCKNVEVIKLWPPFADGAAHEPIQRP
ncbi:recombinase family protein, partial [Erwinia persicina]